MKASELGSRFDTVRTEEELQAVEKIYKEELPSLLFDEGHEEMVELFKKRGEAVSRVFPG